jgi:hypothetical protein
MMRKFLQAKAFFLSDAHQSALLQSKGRVLREVSLQHELQCVSCCSFAGGDSTSGCLLQSAQGGYPVNASAPFGAITCKPRFPEYLQDLR